MNAVRRILKALLPYLFATIVMLVALAAVLAAAAGYFILVPDFIPEALVPHVRTVAIVVPFLALLYAVLAVAWLFRTKLDKALAEIERILGDGFPTSKFEDANVPKVLEALGRHFPDALLPKDKIDDRRAIWYLNQYRQGFPKSVLPSSDTINWKEFARHLLAQDTDVGTLARWFKRRFGTNLSEELNDPMAREILNALFVELPETYLINDFLIKHHAQELWAALWRQHHKPAGSADSTHKLDWEHFTRSLFGTINTKALEMDETAHNLRKQFGDTAYSSTMQETLKQRAREWFKEVTSLGDQAIERAWQASRKSSRMEQMAATPTMFEQLPDSDPQAHSQTALSHLPVAISVTAIGVLISFIPMASATTGVLVATTGATVPFILMILYKVLVVYPRNDYTPDKPKEKGLVSPVIRPRTLMLRYGALLFTALMRNRYLLKHDDLQPSDLVLRKHKGGGFTAITDADLSLLYSFWIKWLDRFLYPFFILGIPGLLAVALIVGST